MKHFFSTAFACVLGLFIAIILFSIISFFSFVSFVAMSSGKSTYSVKNNSILHITLEGELQERSKEDPFGEIMPKEYRFSTIGLDELSKAIEVAKTNNSFNGIYLECKGVSGGYAILQDLRSKLVDFAESGKFIVAYADSYSQKDYYLASAATQIYMNPVGSFDFRGLSSDITFYKNALEKVGVEVQIFKVGTFKSAVEPFIATKMSSQNKEQTITYLGNIWNSLLSDIAISRKLTTEQLNEYANTLTMFDEPQKMIDLGLISELKYRTEVLSLLATLTDKPNFENVELASPAKVATLYSKPQYIDAIAIIYAIGEIDGADPTEGIRTEKLVKDLSKLTADSTVKAVVMYVNSPGGSAFGSEQVWKAVEDLKTVKPVIVSMGNYAASGGYYISCGATRIFAHPTTLTGSIGIFGMIPNANNLLTDKLGLSFDHVATNKYGNFPNLTQPMSADEKAAMQHNVERGYKLFTTRCANGRNIPIEKLLTIAEGRVWSGKSALELGLVDELGDMEDAIKWTANYVNLENYSVIEYPRKKTFFEEFMASFEETAVTYIGRSIVGENYKHYKLINSIQQLDHMQTRMEYIELN